jgi:hypothetical protein
MAPSADGRQLKIGLPAGAALDALLDLIEWCRSERSNLQRQLCALESGKFRIGENTGTGWVDTTAASIERITGSISELDQILAAYERSAKARESAPVSCSTGRIP